MFQRSPLPRRVQLALLVSCAAAGALGCLPGAAGSLDPVAELAWLALFAPAAGAWCGALGSTCMPVGLALSGSWFLFLVAADAASPRDLATPLWSALALAGLFALGLACGSVFGRLGRGARVTAGAQAAGALLFSGLVASGASVGFGLSAGPSALAREHPRLARFLFDASPLTLVFDCAGWDWAHAQPEVYARAGVEWFQRRPYPGSLAGPTVLVVGLGASWLLRARIPVRERAGSRPS